MQPFRYNSMLPQNLPTPQSAAFDPSVPSMPPTSAASVGSTMPTGMFTPISGPPGTFPNSISPPTHHTTLHPGLAIPQQHIRPQSAYHIPPSPLGFVSHPPQGQYAFQGASQSPAMAPSNTLQSPMGILQPQPASHTYPAPEPAIQSPQNGAIARRREQRKNRVEKKSYTRPGDSIEPWHKNKGNLAPGNCAYSPRSEASPTQLSYHPQQVDQQNPVSPHPESPRQVATPKKASRKTALRAITPRSIAPRQIGPRPLAPRPIAPRLAIPQEATRQQAFPYPEMPYQTGPRLNTPLQRVAPHQVAPQQGAFGQMMPQEAQPFQSMAYEMAPMEWEPEFTQFEAAPQEPVLEQSFSQPQVPKQPQPQPIPETESQQANNEKRKFMLGVYFQMNLDKGVNVFNDNEQEWIRDWIDSRKAEQRGIIYRIAYETMPRSLSMATVNAILNWAHVHEGNDKLIVDLMAQRLYPVDGGEHWPEWKSGEIMSLDEVDELMTCQINMDASKKALENKGTE